MFVEGRLDKSRETPSVHVNRVIPVEAAPRLLAQGLLIRLRQVEDETLERLKATLHECCGPLPVVLEFRTAPETVARVKAGPGWSVEAVEDLLDRVGTLPDVAAAEYLAHAP